MDPNCIFCKIIADQAPAKIVYRDEQVTAFQDIHPKAPVHLLIIPNQHIPSLNEAKVQDQNLLGHMLLVAKKLAAESGVGETGYRLVINTGPDSGQIVFHIHLHLVGGRVIPTDLFTNLSS